MNDDQLSPLPTLNQSIDQVVMAWTNSEKSEWYYDRQEFVQLESLSDEFWLGKQCFDHVTTFAVLLQLGMKHYKPNHRSKQSDQLLHDVGSDNSPASNGLWIASLCILGEFHLNTGLVSLLVVTSSLSSLIEFLS